jgi:hypothetical protein
LHKGAKINFGDLTPNLTYGYPKGTMFNIIIQNLRDPKRPGGRVEDEGWDNSLFVQFRDEKTKKVDLRQMLDAVQRTGIRKKKGAKRIYIGNKCMKSTRRGK